MTILHLAGHTQQTDDPPALFHFSPGRPVIGFNPVLLSSLDEKKWERRVSLDNSCTKMLSMSFSLCLFHTHMIILSGTKCTWPPRPWSMLDYCGRISVVQLPAHSLKQLSCWCHFLIDASAHLTFTLDCAELLNYSPGTTFASEEELLTKWH